MESPIVGIIVFVFIIFAMVNIIYITTDQLDTLKVSIDAQVQREVDGKSFMEVLSINCSYPNLNQTDIHLKNTGSNKLLVARLDVFFEDRFSRRNDNRSIEIITDTEFADPLHWNPEEEINVSLYKDLENDTIYQFTLVNEFGGKTIQNCKVLVK